MYAPSTRCNNMIRPVDCVKHHMCRHIFIPRYILCDYYTLICDYHTLICDYHTNILLFYFSAAVFFDMYNVNIYDEFITHIYYILYGYDQYKV